MHRGGRFTALKKKSPCCKKKKKRRRRRSPVGFPGVSQAPQDWSQSIIFLSERWVQMNGRSTSSPASAQHLGRYCSVHWACLACLAYCLSSRPCQHWGLHLCPLQRTFILYVKHCAWNWHQLISPVVCVRWTVFSFTWKYFLSLGFWVFSGFLFYWKSDLPRCSLWQWISLCRPWLRLPSNSHSRPGTERKGGTDPFASLCSLRLGGCLQSLPSHIQALNAVRGLYFF